ncbi:MAG: TIGR02449 family protein [Porticoccaceae bacterium]|jgi:cell division protein ZapB|nr:TIGR02449 family protein [Porticoccaceae bacterium]|tara:strand:- start:254 stop:454 length:201 start_codon:yes stop_codon:yes gene_type:complete
MSEPDNFEQKLDQLIELCQQLKRDNHALRNREDELLGERSQLMKKNDMARQKVETMINRLQALSSE